MIRLPILLSSRRFGRSTSGTVVIDFAMVAPMMVLLALGTVEFGRIVTDLHTAEKSVRAAARLAARLPAPSLGPGGWGYDQVRALALGYGSAGTATFAADWVTAGAADAVTVSFDSGDAEVVQVAVTVPIRFAFLDAVGLPPLTDYRLIHEERHVGE